MATIDQRRDAIMARASTATLLDAALSLDLEYAQGGMPEDQRRAYVWTIDELERRHKDALEPFFDAWYGDENLGNYDSKTSAEVIHDALRELGII